MEEALDLSFDRLLMMMMMMMMMKLVSKILCHVFISKKKICFYSTCSSFLVINVCNQGKTLCSLCILNFANIFQKKRILHHAVKDPSTFEIQQEGRFIIDNYF